MRADHEQILEHARQVRAQARNLRADHDATKARMTIVRLFRDTVAADHTRIRRRFVRINPALRSPVRPPAGR